MLTAYLFYLTGIVLVVYFIRVLSILVGKPISMGNIFGIDLAVSYISYPSIGFQIYFWTDYLGLFNITELV